MADELDEVIEFLCDDRDEVKGMAVDILKGLTGSQEGLDRLHAKTSKLLPLLLRLTKDPSKETASGACTALVNLSQDSQIVRKLLALGVVDRVMDYIREGTCAHVDKMMMLLSNVTVPEDGARAMLQYGKGNLTGLHISRLLGMFLKEESNSGDYEGDEMEHFANVMTNVTQVIEGRTFLMEPGRGVVKALAGQLDIDRSNVRRKGCAQALRNCFYTCRADGTLEGILEAKDCIPQILRPISGEEPKEPEDDVRVALAEAVLMLAAEGEGCDALLEHDTHLVLKKGYEMEENLKVCEAMERTAVIFMTKGQVEPEEGEAGGEQQDHEVQCEVIPGGFSLGRM